jgi:hypothetical protein
MTYWHFDRIMPAGDEQLARMVDAAQPEQVTEPSPIQAVATNLAQSAHSMGAAPKLLSEASIGEGAV